MDKLFKRIKFAIEEFWLNLTFNMNLECGVHYEFIPTDGLSKIKILRGRYRDVILTVHTVSLKEPQGAYDVPVLSFNMTIHEPSIYTKDFLMSDAGFINRVGEIISSIILKDAEPHRYEQNREDDFEESTLQSEVYEESVTFLKD